MEAKDMIFENYGSERLARIFKNYWILLLFLKQVMLSFFMVDPPTNSFPGEGVDYVQEISTDEKDEPLLNLDFVRLLILIAHLNSDVQIEQPSAN